MALYEHVFIARQDLSNAQAEGLIEHFGQILKDNGGEVDGSEYWGLRTMAYKMNKNRKGHYGFLKSNAPAPAVAEMERLMRLHDDVLRVLTVRVEEHEEGPSAVIQAKNSRDERGRGGRGGRDRPGGDRDRGPREDRGPRPPRD
ncbi:MAG: 30S ribosomal protein S6 [Pseudomonadota bacterium]